MPLAEYARYALLEHSWNGVHWDFMIEHHGQLRTWSLQEQPGRLAEIPARELPPHRLLYLEYEGPISGDRGSVRRLDQGTYTPRVWTTGLLILALKGGCLTGQVELRDDSDRRDPAQFDYLGRNWTFRWNRAELSPSREPG